MDTTENEVRELFGRLSGAIDRLIERAEKDYAAENAEKLTQVKIDDAVDRALHVLPPSFLDQVKPHLLTLVRYASIALLSHGRMGAKLARRQDEVRELHERIRVLEHEKEEERARAVGIVNGFANGLLAAKSERNNRVISDDRARKMRLLDNAIDDHIVATLSDIAIKIDPEGMPF